MEDYNVPATAPWIGKSLGELDLGKRYGVQVVSILRGDNRINIPKAGDRLFPFDKIQVIGVVVDETDR